MATPKQIDLLIGSILIQRVRLHNVISLLHVYRLYIFYVFVYVLHNFYRVEMITVNLVPASKTYLEVKKTKIKIMLSHLKENC